MDYSKYSDDKLTEDIKTSACSESLKMLIERHSPYCYKLYKNFGHYLANCGYYQDDFNSDKDYLIWKASSSYKKDKSKFITWLGITVYFHFKTILRKGKHGTLVPIDSKDAQFILRNVSYKDNLDEGIKEYVLSMLDKFDDKRIKKVYKMRYFDRTDQETPWREIAKELNLSIQATINIHKSVKKYLKHTLTREQIVTKI